MTGHTSFTPRQLGIELLGIVTLVVNDQAEALEVYTGTLDFETRSDEAFERDGETGRWLPVGVSGDGIDVALVTADALREIMREPETFPWVTEAMFTDPSGNQSSLFEYAVE